MDRGSLFDTFVGASLCVIVIGLLVTLLGPWVGVGAYIIPGAVIGAQVCRRFDKQGVDLTFGAIAAVLLVVASWPAHLTFTVRDRL